MRLIDADALRQKIEECALEADRASSFLNPDGGAVYDEVLDAIDAAPTIDPNIQRPIAHWVKGEDIMSMYYACSRCEHKARERFGTSAYCPHCGAVMIGD